MKHVIKLWLITGLPMIAVAIGVALVLSGHSAEGAIHGLLSWRALVVAVAALTCEYVDSTLGMGYGTTLTPILLCVGYAPLEVVPAVLLSQLAAGTTGALLHHRADNVDFRRGGLDLKIATVLAISGVVGALAAVLVAVSVPALYLKLYIGILVLSMGLIILVMKGREGRFSWRKVAGLGLIAAFNKGMSGGGYGPVVTCGQILSGVTGRRAVGITSLAEAVVCLVAVAGFVLMVGVPGWSLSVPLLVGAVCSTPLAVWTVTKTGTRKLALAIGISATVLGAVTLTKVIWG